MMLTNPSMKEKYPYWYQNAMEQEEQRRIERLIDMAEWRIENYLKGKMQELEQKIRDIEVKVNGASFNIETTLNNQSMIDSGAINREIKKMVVNEIRKALK